MSHEHDFLCDQNQGFRHCLKSEKLRRKNVNGRTCQQLNKRKNL